MDSPKATTSVSEALALALDCHRMGRLADAKAICQKVLQVEPNDPGALGLLGAVTLQSGETDKAIALLELATRLAPRNPEYRNNLGVAYRALGRMVEAERSYRAAIEIRPDYVEAHDNLALTLQKLGRSLEAEQCYRRALAMKPHDPGLLANLAGALSDLGRLDEAEQVGRQAIMLAPDSAVAHNNLGVALERLGRLDDAIRSFRKAAALAPVSPEVHNSLGVVLFKLNRVHEAEQSFRQAVSLKPDYAEARYNLAGALQPQGRPEESLASLDLALALSPARIEYWRSRLRVLLHLTDIDQAALFAARRDFVRRFAPNEMKRLPPIARAPGRTSQLKVGFLGSDFRTHPIATNIHNLFAYRDPAQLSFTIYSATRFPDAMTAWFRNQVDCWRDVTEMSDREVAELARRDEIDVLVVLAGTFDANRPLVAEWRAAPIQVSFLDGATSGSDEMDYWLTDAVLHPQHTSELFSESLCRLPVLFSYPAPDRGLLHSGAPPAVAAGRIAFGSFCHPRKLTEFTIALWSRVLRAVPDSQLILKYHNLYEDAAVRDHFMARFATHNVEAGKRIRFIPGTQAHDIHVQDYRMVDIALDTFPFNGATTTFEALTMGVPVIALAGETFISRMSASMLDASGLAKLIAVNSDGFVACAARLARDLEDLIRKRRVLRSKLANSPLCDGPAYARAFEAAIRDMNRQRAGESLGKS